MRIILPKMPQKTLSRRSLVFALSVLSPLLVLALRLSIAESFGNRPLLILFMPAIIGCSLLGGLWSGVVATAVSALGISYFAIPPIGTFAITTGHDMLQWSVLIISGILVSLLSEQLRRREQSYRLLVEHQTDMVVKVDAQGRFLYVSPSYCSTFGKREEELIGSKFAPLVHEEDLPATLKAIQSLSTPPHTAYMEQRALTPSGYRWFAWQDTAVLGPDGEVAEIIGVGRDISAKMQDRDAMLRAQESLASMFNAITESASLIDCSGVVIMANTTFCARLGLSPNECIGQNIFHLVPENQREQRRTQVQTVIRTKAPVSFEDERGGLILRHRLYPVLGADGEVERLAIFATDITERNAAILALKSSEERFRTLFEEMDSGLSLHEVICNEQGRPVDYRFLEVNPAFEKLTGLKAESVIGHTVLEVMPKTEQVWIERFGQVALSGEPAEFEEFSGELGRWYETKAFSPAAGQFAVLFKDTTSRKLGQIRLAESEERFRMLASESPVSIVSFDALGMVTFVSRWHLSEFAKNRLDESFFTGRKIWELPSIISAGLAEDVRGILDGTVLNRFEVHVPSNCIGEETYQNMRGVPFLQDGVIIGGVLIRENITERKRAEEELIRSRVALEESRANLVLALEMASMGNWELDLNTMVFTFSEQFYALYATTLELENGPFMAVEAYASRFVHPDEAALVESEIRQVLEGEYDARPAQIEHRIVRRDGAIRDVVVRFLVAKDHDGRRLKTIGVNQDITELKQATLEIQRNVTRLQCLVRTLQHDSKSTQEYLDFCLSQALILTDSKFGYIYHYNEERREFLLNTWSSDVMKECNVKGAPRTLPP